MNVDIPAPVSGGVILSYKCNAECLHFTGGEPFLNFELLCRAVELADGFGIPSTFVETNCFWCVSDA